MKILFHIGLHKTGTTWLQKCYFRRHPEISLITDTGRPWNDALIRMLVRGEDSCGGFDPGRCREIVLKHKALSDPGASRGLVLVSAERLSGHPWSGGYDRYHIARRIHAAFPEAKILCALRKQADMLVSVYRQMVAEGFPATFDDFYLMDSWKGASFDRRMYCYDVLVEQYQSIFGVQNVLIMPYERLRSEPDAFLCEVCEFADITKKLRDDSRFVNTSLSGRALAVMRVVNRFRRTELNRCPVFTIKEDVVRAIRNKLKLLPRGREELISADRLDDIENYYEKSNFRLEQRLGKEFSIYRRH